MFYPGNPEQQIQESNRERQGSNHQRQKVKSSVNQKILETESISKHFIGQPLQYKRPKTQNPQNSVIGNTTQTQFSVANRTTRTETKIKQQTGNRTNKNSVANDGTNYAVNRKVSEGLIKYAQIHNQSHGYPFS